MGTNCGCILQTKPLSSGVDGPSVVVGAIEVRRSENDWSFELPHLET